MWQPDRSVHGPVRATRRDVDELNRVFADAFTERYRRDGLHGVRVPALNPAIWHYAIADAADGAMVWREPRGGIIAFNMVHVSGAEGWMGPLAVRTDRQGGRIGQQVVRAGVEWLQAHGVTTIGLETMPRTIDNIGFYSRLGFRPGFLTVTLQRDRPRGQAAPESTRLGASPAARRAEEVSACAALSRRLGAGVDFTREINLTLELGLGDVTLLRDADGDSQAFALWHTAPLAQHRPREELRVLKLVAPDVGTTMRLMSAVEREASAHALQHVSVRCQSAYGDVYAQLLEGGYRVQWTDLRLTLAGAPEPVRTGVVLSNWEI